MPDGKVTMLESAMLADAAYAGNRQHKIGEGPLAGWKAVKTVDEHLTSGLRMTIVQKEGTNTYAILCEGTNLSEKARGARHLLNDVPTALAMSSTSSVRAVEEARKFVAEHPTANIYAFGHSKGGFEANEIGKFIPKVKVVGFNPPHEAVLPNPALVANGHLGHVVDQAIATGRAAINGEQGQSFKFHLKGDLVHSAGVNLNGKGMTFSDATIEQLNRKAQSGTPGVGTLAAGFGDLHSVTTCIDYLKRHPTFGSMSVDDVINGPAQQIKNAVRHDDHEADRKAWEAGKEAREHERQKRIHEAQAKHDKQEAQRVSSMQPRAEQVLEQALGHQIKPDQLKPVPPGRFATGTVVAQTYDMIVIENAPGQYRFAQKNLHDPNRESDHLRSQIGITTGQSIKLAVDANGQSHVYDNQRSSERAR